MATLKCTIVLDKAEGLTMKVEDSAGGAIQTIQLLKDAIIMTVSGKESTSVVTQKADSVAVKCKKFSVEADEISCQSKMASTFAAKTEMKISGTETVAIEGLSAKLSGTTVQIVAQGALSAEATGPATLKGSVANVSAPVVNLG
jgi:phage baseplate assembly protein gpV